MLLLEGVPAILGGAWCYFFSPTDRSRRSGSPLWKKLAHSELARDRLQRPNLRALGTWQAIADSRCCLLSLIYFVYQVGSLGVWVLDAADHCQPFRAHDQL